MDADFTEEELLAEELVLSKIDVIRRQLNAGIRMFFDDYDPVALHTVIAAGHEVVRNIAHSKGIRKSVKDSPLIADSERKRYIDQVNYAQNFFKHADRDQNSKMVFRYKVIPLFIIDAVMQYIAIGEELNHEMRVFLVWTQLKYPSLICHEPAEKELSQVRKTTQDPNAYHAIAKALLNDYPPPSA